MDLEGKIKISELKPHPKNNYYFDDMDGDAWDALLQSISTSGVTNAITITKNKVIISGHQRVRACKVLGIEEISYKMVQYENEKKEIKDLIESNLRQRVLGNDNPIKTGKCFDFLNDYYGFHHGGDRKSSAKLLHLKDENEPTNQTELADSYGISHQTMNNYIRMAKMIPELEELVDTGIVTKDTALAMIKNLSEDEQLSLIASLDTTKKITKKEMQRYIDKIKKLEEDNEKIVELETKVSDLEHENKNLESLNSSLENAKALSEQISERYKKNSDEYDTLKNKISDMGLNPEGDYNTYVAITEISNLNKEIQDFLLNKLSPTKYQNYIFAVKGNEKIKRNLVNTLNLVKEWYTSMLLYLEEDMEEKFLCTNIVDMEEH